jgi:hypothetical protein
MATQPVALSQLPIVDPYSYSLSPGRGDRRAVTFQGDSSLPRSASSPTRQLSLQSEYYSSDKLSMQFQNKDGDTVTLNLEHVEYQKQMMSVDGANLSDKDWKALVDNIKQQYQKMREDMIRKFMDGVDGKIDGSTDESAPASTDQQIPGLPEYWNAENTSQRIVDFALQFAGAFQGGDEEFMKAIKAAVDEGFKQAGDLFGDMPDAVSNLVSNTHDLVMKKFDAWLESRKGAASPESTGATSPETGPSAELAGAVQV